MLLAKALENLEIVYGPWPFPTDGVGFSLIIADKGSTGEKVTVLEKVGDVGDFEGNPFLLPLSLVGLLAKAFLRLGPYQFPWEEDWHIILEILEIAKRVFPEGGPVDLGASRVRVIRGNPPEECQ